MRTQYKTSVIFILTLLLSACIERYFIDENENNLSKIVIEGTITDLCEPQEIVISHSSSTDFLEFLPYSDCKVMVVDADNNRFEFTEDQSNIGHYKCTVDEKYLLAGNKFKLTVLTPDSQLYESGFEEMLPCTEIDSLYYEIQKKPTADADKTLDGIQFYLDFKGSDFFSPFYRWTIDETYEYHSFWPIKDYYDENNRFVHTVGPPDYSRFICFKTNTIDGIFSLSTDALIQNCFKGFMLNFVDDHTQRLFYQYSILVKQFSLNEQAYNYWDKMKKNNKLGAGLFTKQPAKIVGNIVNINDSEDVALGYFGVSSVTTKRIVVERINELKFNDMFVCVPAFLKYNTLPWEPRPIYLFYDLDPADESWSLAWAYAECVDCTTLEGVLEKPDFFN